MAASQEQKELKAGKIILRYYQQATKKDAPPQAADLKSSLGQKVKYRRGRPRKAKADQVRTISFKARPDLIELLEKIKLPYRKAIGKGGKIRYMILKYLQYHARERAQIRVIYEALKLFTKRKNEYMAAYTQQDPKAAAKLLAALETSVRHLRLLIKLYKISQRDLERLLKPYKRDLNFAFLWPLGGDLAKTKKAKASRANDPTESSSTAAHDLIMKHEAPET